MSASEQAAPAVSLLDAVGPIGPVGAGNGPDMLTRADAGAGVAQGQPAASMTVLDVDGWTRRHAYDLLATVAPDGAEVTELEEAVAADAIETALGSKPTAAARPQDGRRAEWWQQMLTSPELATMRAKTVSRVGLADVAALALAKQWHDYAATLPDEPPPGEQPEGQDGNGGGDIASDVARIRSTMQAVKQAAKDVDAADSYAAGLGGGDGGRLSATDMLAALRRMQDSPLLAAIMEQAGRWRAATDRAQAASTERPGAEIVGIHLSGDLAHALPTQAAYVAGAVPELELLYGARLASRALVSYKTRRHEPVKRGPLVVTVDESGSMAGARIIQAKALALAMVHLARQQKRPITLCAFAGTPEIRAVDGRADKAAVETWLLDFMNGGTIGEGPLQAVPGYHWPSGEIGQRCDHIIVSDGALTVPDDMAEGYKAWAKAYGVRTWVIAIGAGSAGGWSDVADRVYVVDALSPDKVSSMLGAL